MPPTVTLADLIESNRRLADSNFATAAAINKLVNELGPLRRDIYDVKADRETDVRMYFQTMEGVRKELTTIAERMQRMPGDVTGAFKLAQAEDNERTLAERMFARLERAPTSTKLWVLVFAIIVLASGWARHLFE